MWTAEAVPIFHARTKTVALAYPLTMPALARTPIRGNMPLRRPSYSARRLRESVTLGSLGNDTGNSGESTLRALLERCAQGDRQAFRTLYDMQAPRMHGLAMRITRDTALAADATFKYADNNRWSCGISVPLLNQVEGYHRQAVQARDNVCAGRPLRPFPADIMQR